MSGRRLDCERGSSAVTLVLLMPIVLIVVWFAVFAGRMVTAQQDVISAARDGARAAAVSGTSDGGSAAATAAVERTLRGAGVACSDQAAEVELGDFGAGGTVTVTVRCTVSIADVTSVWAPGLKVIEASSTAVIDQYRGGDQ